LIGPLICRDDRQAQPRTVNLIRNRKRETKTHRSARRSAGKAANRSNKERRAPQQD
jgi:hypothetical protein